MSAILVLILASVLFGIVAPSVIACRARSGQRRSYMKDIIVPLYTPVMVGILGIVFGLVSEHDKTVEADSQKKIELLREMIASKDRPDIAYVTAVGDQLTLHLRRRAKALAKEVAAVGGKRNELAQARVFEEKAAYFFYGMFHTALIDFYATKGYQLYPRLWMEEVFYGLSSRVRELVYGGKSESDPDIPGDEESAIYRYFGAAAGTFQTIVTERTGEPGKAAVLFEFQLMLSGVNSRSEKQDPVRERMEESLKTGWLSFQKRLNSTGTDRIDVSQLIVVVEALTALDDYAFNKLFDVWYTSSDAPAEVEALAREIPGVVSGDPPQEFLFYPLRNWEGKEFESERQKIWGVIYGQVTSVFRRPKPQ